MLRRVLCLLLVAHAGCARSGLEGLGIASSDASVDAEAPPDAGIDAGSPPEARRAPFSIANARLQAVSAHEDGTFLVLYSVSLVSEESPDLRLQRFDAWAAPLGEPIVLYTSNRFGLTGDAVFLADGSFVAAFPVLIGSSPTRLDYAVRVRRFAPDGTPRTPNAPDRPSEWRPRVVGLAGGGFVVATQRWNDDVSEMPLGAEIFDGEGRVRSSLSRALGCGRIVANPEGGFDLLCVEDEGVRIRRHDATGELLRATQVVEPLGLGIDALAYGPEGELLVTSGGHLRRLDAAGRPESDWEDLRWPGAAATTRVSELAASGGGALPARLTALWQEELNEPRARRLDGLGAPLADLMETPLAEAPDPAGSRFYYDAHAAAGSSYGQTVLAWSRTHTGPVFEQRVDGVVIVGD